MTGHHSGLTPTTSLQFPSNSKDYAFSFNSDVYQRTRVWINHIKEVAGAFFNKQIKLVLLYYSVRRAGSLLLSGWVGGWGGWEVGIVYSGLFGVVFMSPLMCAVEGARYSDSRVLDFASG